jgi:hypothetical protein
LESLIDFVKTSSNNPLDIANSADEAEADLVDEEESFGHDEL